MHLFSAIADALVPGTFMAGNLAMPLASLVQAERGPENRRSQALGADQFST